mmetsp:Transcript_58806/g.140015  ORF Transcript_58806/g.140015 Transcript_58806/m.140015 type:complete len:90 (-) Transcript_58806:129-398(-)
MNVSGPNLAVPVASRPDEFLSTADEPPIEMAIQLSISVDEAKEPAVEQNAFQEPKIEIQPNPNRQSKIKRKATGFVKNGEETRKCCVLM